MIWNTVTSLFGWRRSARAPTKMMIPVDLVRRDEKFDHGAWPAMDRAVLPARALSAAEVAASLPPRSTVSQPPTPPVLDIPAFEPLAPAESAVKESMAVSNQPPAPFPSTPPMPQRTAPPVVNPQPLPARPQLPPQGGEPQSAPTPAARAAGQQLVVGRGIFVSARITNCDRLVVEGDVRATLTESRSLEVAATGTFNGTAVIEDAEIAGQFDGELHVHGRLNVRATGRIKGRIRYGSIEIQAGGEVSGQIAVHGDELPATETPAPAAAPRSAASAPGVPAAPAVPPEQQAQELLSRNFRGPRSRH
jgi:cytoskeletal protein CcmA (bactofilin family)